MKTALAILGAASMSSANQTFLQDADDVVKKGTQVVDGLMKGFESKDGDIWKTCPKTDIAQNFDQEKYLGTWYELHRAKVQSQEDGECVRAVYSVRDDGYIGVNNTQERVDKDGNIVDNQGRKKFDKSQATPDGDLPKLFNYNGRRFDIVDTIG